MLANPLVRPTPLHAPRREPARSGPAATLVVTSHPTARLPHAVEAHIAAKLQRNPQHKYETPLQVRDKYARYIGKRLAFLQGLKEGRFTLDQETFPPDIRLSPKAVARLRAELQAGEFRPPTVEEEGRAVATQIDSTLDAMLHLALDPSENARATFDLVNKPKTWASRDNDRSKVALGDQAGQFATQVAGACDSYERLIDSHAESHPFFQAGALRAELAKCRGVAQELQALVRRCRHDKALLRAELTAFAAAPEHDLKALEDRMFALCDQQPQDAFSRVFRKFGINVFDGEVRVNASGLQADGSADARRVDEVLDEMQMLHRIYPDTGSVVIADFSHLDQAARLQQALAARGLDVETVPLLESKETVEYFLRHVADFKRLGLGTLMLAGSDLARGDGTAEAIVLRHAFNLACMRAGFTPYHGLGTSIGRNGVGLTDGTLMADNFAHLFQPAREGGPRQVRLTTQGTQARQQLANGATAQRYFRSLQTLVPARRIDPGQVDQARQVFAGLTACELAMRDPHGRYAALYQQTPALRELRNLSNFHGSRDAKKPDLPNLYADRAIGADASTTSNALAATFAFQDLARQPGAVQALVDGIRQGLQQGNPVVRDIVVNYALQASGIFFGDQCLAKWRAAGFSDAAIADLDASRQVMLQVLDAVGFSLADNTTLQRYVMEYLGIDPSFHADDPAHNLAAIRERQGRAGRAGIAALQANARRKQPGLAEDERKLESLLAAYHLADSYQLLGAKS